MDFLSETTVSIAVIQCSIKSWQCGDSAMKRGVALHSFHAKYLDLCFENQNKKIFFQNVFSADYRLRWVPPVLGMKIAMWRVAQNAGKTRYKLLKWRILTFIHFYWKCFSEKLMVSLQLSNAHSKDLKILILFWINVVLFLTLHDIILDFYFEVWIF